MESFRRYMFLYEKEPRLSFYVRSCGHFSLIPPDRELYRSRVDFCEIFWCIRGKGIFRNGLRESVLNPGYVWYYPAGSCQDYVPMPGGFEYHWLTIAGLRAEELFSGLDIRPGLNYAGPCPDELFLQVEKNLEEGPSRTSRMQALAAAFRILTMISPGQHPERIVRGSMAEQAKKLIDSSYTDGDFNVEKTASLLGVHRGSLSRAFADGYGITVSRYITSCRIRHAMKLLGETAMPIREAALAAGFNSHEYFSRVFLEQTGYTPAAFRKKRERE